MIVDKNEAIEEMKKPCVDFRKVDISLLKDKDVALAYMERHSSNNMLVDNFPINVNSNGLVDDEDFILNLIKNLDVGYSEEALESLVKHSTFRIIKRKTNENTECDIEKVREEVLGILTNYNENIKIRSNELSARKSMLSDIGKFIEVAKLDAFNNDKQRNRQKLGFYKDCNIGFTAKF